MPYIGCTQRKAPTPHFEPLKRPLHSFKCEKISSKSLAASPKAASTSLQVAVVPSLF
jgi:hypothetical protein